MNISPEMRVEFLRRVVEAGDEYTVRLTHESPHDGSEHRYVNVNAVTMNPWDELQLGESLRALGLLDGGAVDAETGVAKFSMTGLARDVLASLDGASFPEPGSYVAASDTTLPLAQPDARGMTRRTVARGEAVDLAVLAPEVAADPELYRLRLVSSDEAEASDAAAYDEDGRGALEEVRAYEVRRAAALAALVPEDGDE